MLPTDTANLAVNVARLVAGEPGASIHAYSDYFSFTGTQLANTLRTAGYTYTTGVGIPFDLATLSAYDAIVMGLPLPSSARLEVCTAVRRARRQRLHSRWKPDLGARPGAQHLEPLPRGLRPPAWARVQRPERQHRRRQQSHPAHRRFTGVHPAGHPITGCCIVATSSNGVDLFAVSGTTYTRYLAEGATGPFFDTRIALLNTGTTPTTAAMRFLKQDGTIVNRSVTVNGLTRVTVDPESIPGLQQASFSTVIGSSSPLVIDRTMSWDASGYAARAGPDRPLLHAATAFAYDHPGRRAGA